MVNAEKPDLVILDLMIAGAAGHGGVRTDPAPGGDRLPADHHADGKVRSRGQDPGAGDRADDYITKPFHVRSSSPVSARSSGARNGLRRRICRRRSIIGGSTSIFGPTGDLERSADRPEFREFKLLQFFTGHPGRVYSRDQLLDRVWGDEAFVEPRTVDVHISRLRAAIEPDKENPQYILTVRGIGYKFTDEKA